MQVDWHTMQKVSQRIAAMPIDEESGERKFTQAYDVKEKSCNAYPEHWSKFVIEMLDEICRPSECKKDQARDKNPPHTMHTIHWIEMKYAGMCSVIRKAGS